MSSRGVSWETPGNRNRREQRLTDRDDSNPVRHASPTELATTHLGFRLEGQIPVQDKSTGDPWRRLVQVITDRGALGVIAMVLGVTLACVVTGVGPTAIYALVALVVAFTVLIAVTVLLLRGRMPGGPPNDLPGSRDGGDEAADSAAPGEDVADR